MKYTRIPAPEAYTRLLSLDVGEKRIGIAGSDDLGIAAHGVDTVDRRKPEEDTAKILGIARDRGAQAIIVGLPRNMDGSYGFAAERSREFARLLIEKTDLPVLFEDERLTTVSAEKILLESGMSRQHRKSVIDRLSAVIILESFLKRQERRKNMSEDQERLVELIDENGNKVIFQHEITLHYQDADYAMVVPVEGLEPADDDEGELVALKIVPGETEDLDTYEGVEDEELLDTLYEMYLEEMEALEDEDQ